MAESPASQVYSPGILGDAVVLGSGLGPLTVLRQEAAAKARAKAAAAKLKQQQEESDARNFVPVTGDGWGVHNEQITKMTQEALDLNKKDYQKQELTPYERKSKGFGRANEVKQAADASNEMKANHAATMATAKAEPRYDSAKVDKAFMDTLYNIDPETGQRGTDIPIPQVDIKKQQNVLNQTDVLNKGEVYKTFIKGLADEENVRIGKAALPGGFGSTTVFDSNIFAHDKDGNPIYNADRSSKIANMPRLLARMQDDPFVRKVLQQDAIDNQRAAGSQQMMSGSPQMDGYSQLTPEQNAILQSLPTAGAQQTQVNSATDISRYGKTKTSNVQLYRDRPQPRQATVKATDALATNTSGFMLQNTMESVPSNLTTGMAPGVNGVYDYAQPFAKPSGSMPKPTNSYIPSTGQSFGTQKNGYVTMNLSSNGITTMGSDGKPNATNVSGSNSQVPFQANGRHTILFLDGNPIPGQGDGTGQNARQEQSKILEGAKRSGQGHRVTGQEYYVGGTVDKSKVAGDGAGGAPKIIGYQDPDKNMISEQMAAELTRAGVVVTPVLAKEDNLIKGLHPATQEGDAQLRRMVKGYDPSKLSAEQQSLIKELESIGGRHISPYSVTKPAGKAKPTYVKPAAKQEGKSPAHNPYYIKSVK